jgi:hypothetical protein
MRNIEYITNGFGAPTQGMGGWADGLAQTLQQLRPAVAQTLLPAAIPQGYIKVPQYAPPGSIPNQPAKPMFTDLGYLTSPSGGGFGAGGGGRVYNLQERFGDLVSRMVPFGLNPRFLDIVRGPGGKGYLSQTIRLVNAYRSNLRRYKYNINAAYNNSVAIAGGESLLMPRAFLTNPDLISDIDDGDIMNWLKTVFSAL